MIPLTSRVEHANGTSGARWRGSRLDAPQGRARRLHAVLLHLGVPHLDACDEPLQDRPDPPPPRRAAQRRLGPAPRPRVGRATFGEGRSRPPQPRSDRARSSFRGRACWRLRSSHTGHTVALWWL